MGISSNGNDCRVELTSEVGAAQMQVRALDAFNRCDWLCSVGFSSEVAKRCCSVDVSGAQAPVGGCSLMRIAVDEVFQHRPMTDKMQYVT
jgi:hypothetical protein